MDFGTIDFEKIKGENIAGQQSSFEQLVCELARLDGQRGEFRRIHGAGGDGGVECIRILPNGKKIGYQAKFHLTGDEINWPKLDNSVSTAFTHHPELEQYIIAVPCDFTGTRSSRSGITDGVWGKWDDRVHRWERTTGGKCKFEVWTAFELEHALRLPANQHLQKYFFDRLVFTKLWMDRHLQRSIHDLHARYSPKEHVDVESLHSFDVVSRRENVRNHIDSIFELAKQCNPRAAAAACGKGSTQNTEISNVEKARDDFVSLADSLAWRFDKTWPIQQWFTTWHLFTRQLYHFHNETLQAAQDSAELTNIWPLITPEIFAGQWSALLPIDVLRAVLLVGRSGAGKSHVLARGVENAWKEGTPVLFLLGQHIIDSDPRISFVRQLELGSWSFHETLSALNLMAQAAETRGIVVIDALNEGTGLEVWRKYLKSICHEIVQYERLCLIVSCREEYLEYVVPEELIADRYLFRSETETDYNSLTGKFVRVNVEGFRSITERETAMQVYMDGNAIARPTAPILNAEFFNPLFLSSVCRTMAQVGLRLFPTGLDGTRKLFEFVLNTKAKYLGTRHDDTERVKAALLSFLDELAGRMIKGRCDYVKLDEASSIVEGAFKNLRIENQSWLSVLEGADIVRIDVVKHDRPATTWQRPEEVIRFSFQRLQDTLMAEWLVNACKDLEHAFGPTGVFEFLVTRKANCEGKMVVKFRYSLTGLAGALWAALAEVKHIELWHLPGFFSSPEDHFFIANLRPAFHTSLRERSGSAFSERTQEIFDRLWEDDTSGKISFLLEKACVPEHKWNADYLTTRLFRLQPKGIQELWAPSFDSNSTLFDPLFSSAKERAKDIVDWTSRANAKTDDEEVARLAMHILIWLFAVNNEELRDSAIKAMTNMMASFPAQSLLVMERFATFDNQRIIEGLKATTRGASFLQGYSG